MKINIKNNDNYIDINPIGEDQFKIIYSARKI